jgi:phosphoribosyl 1,2-cyclic phosphate phosphodiesterase
MERIQGVDVLVLNALRRSAHSSHLNLEEALEVAARVGARATYFTHISHLLGLHAEVSTELPPQIYLAYDGLVVPVQG